MTIHQSKYLRELLSSMKSFRIDKGISESELEAQMLLGPGWIECFENGAASFSIEAYFAISNALGFDLPEVLAKINVGNEQLLNRNIRATPNGNGIDLHFQHGSYNAVFHLDNANVKQFDTVILEMRNLLSESVSTTSNRVHKNNIKTNAVARTFFKATSLWPIANPSDLWAFIVNRAYCDPFNHPAIDAKLSFEQSWKRTSGWALEKVFVQQYTSILESSGISIFIAYGGRKTSLISKFLVDDRLEADKADVFLTGSKNGEQIPFGIVHVKASFAERRTDDVPMSKALIKAGYYSPLLTMDCKSTPSNEPYNKGELGCVYVDGLDTRSAKRKDIEDDGYFSACFSYNKNTLPTPQETSTVSRVYCCDFNNPQDDFTDSVITAWESFKSK